jgi:hypothetical protein
MYDDPFKRIMEENTANLYNLQHQSGKSLLACLQQNKRDITMPEKSYIPTQEELLTFGRELEAMRREYNQYNAVLPSMFRYFFATKEQQDTATVKIAILKKEINKAEDKFMNMIYTYGASKY